MDGSRPDECGSYLRGSKPPPLSVFWGCQGYLPALHLWQQLLRAGDVETNPGPGPRDRKSYGVCGRGCSGRGPQCSGCLHHVHLGCSGLSRASFYRREGDRGWVGTCCENGRGVSVRSSEGETRPQRSMNELRRECGVCKKVIRAGTSGVKCTRCGVEGHKCCSGRSR